MNIANELEREQVVRERLTKLTKIEHESAHYKDVFRKYCQSILGYSKNVKQRIENQKNGGNAGTTTGDKTQKTVTNQDGTGTTEQNNEPQMQIGEGKYDYLYKNRLFKFMSATQLQDAYN